MQLALQFDARRKSRLDTQKGRLLTMLFSQEWVTNVDCIRAGIPNFRSRFSEMRVDLRKGGYDISEGERVTAGVWKYRLVRL